MAMQFNINKGSELPYLVMELNDDGRYDFRKFYLAVQSARSVRFTMTNLATGICKVANAEAEVIPDDHGCEERYLLRYRWRKRDTNEAGRFVGRFTIEFDDRIVAEGMDFPKGDLIVPIAEELVINVNDGLIRR